MRLKVWIAIAGAVGLLFAGLYVLSGQIMVGVGFAAAVVAGVAWQLQAESHEGVAAGHVRANFWITLIKEVALIVTLIAVLVILGESAIGHWSKTRQGLVAILALSGLELMLIQEIRRQDTELFRWWTGAEAEVLVQKELDALRDDGWFVYHNFKPEGFGNVDHVVAGPSGVFAIETKSRRYWSMDASQAVRSALAVRQRLGGGWVTAVVCVPGRETPVQKGHVWVVGRDHLAAWLRRQEGRPVEPCVIEARFTHASASA